MPASFFQVIVIGLLFIIAAAFFPPLLLLIPIVLFGLLINGIACLFKKTRIEPGTTVHHTAEGIPLNAQTPRAILEAEYQRTIAAGHAARGEVVRLAGLEFTALVNRGLEGGMTEANLESLFRKHYGINFFIRNGRANVTEDELVRIAPLLGQIRTAFDEADRQLSRER